MHQLTLFGTFYMINAVWKNLCCSQHRLAKLSFNQLFVLLLLESLVLAYDISTQSTSETCLQDECGEIYEQNDFNYERSVEVQTAPVSDGVLPGVIRQVIIEYVLSQRFISAYAENKSSMDHFKYQLQTLYSCLFKDAFTLPIWCCMPLGNIISNYKIAYQLTIMHVCGDFESGIHNACTKCGLVWAEKLTWPCIIIS